MDVIEQLTIDPSVWQGMGGWVTQVFIVVFLTLLLDFVQKIVLRRIKRKTEVTKNLWDDALIESARAPVSVLVWVVGLAFAANIIESSTDAAIFSAMAPLRDVGVIVVIGWFLLRFIRHAEHNVIVRGEGREDVDVDRTTIMAIGKLLRLSVIITSGLVMLQTLGFSVSGVLAFGGVGGVVVGFAAKDLLANFFGGLMILLDRPFAVGDWVRSPDQNIEGTVEHIGWRLTRIRTFDKRPLYVPNSVFANITVENPQRMTHRRIYETIGIRYDDVDKMGAITTDVKQMLLDHSAIDHSQTLMVNFNTFSASSLDFFVYTFTHTTVWTEFHEIKHEILLKIHDIIAKHGAEIAFPTSTVHVPDPVTLDGLYAK